MKQQKLKRKVNPIEKKTDIWFSKNSEKNRTKAEKIAKLFNADEFGNFVGEGSVSEIYWFSKNNKLYSIKINKHRKPYNDFEIKYLNKLSKLELIPKIYEIGPDYIIYDYIDAYSLTELINKTSSIEKFEINKKIQNLIEFYHDSGIPHGDLHTDNILIDSNKNVIFIDPFLPTDLIEFRNNYNSLIKYDLKQISNFKKGIYNDES